MSIYDAIDEYDPLAKLRRAEKALLAAGARGEGVAEELRQVRKAIWEIIDQRAERQEAQRRPRDYERER